MALPGETFGSMGETHGHCPDCNVDLPFQVCKSAAGYYVGTWCQACGPYSRESGYYATQEAAAKALKEETYYRL